MQLQIDQVLHFLDMLDQGGRHTIASEAPFGNNGMPKWEGGATFEAHQRKQLIEDIKERQNRKSNVYYSVNRPCVIDKRTGLYGKNNIDDIIAIRSLAFDIDFTCAKTDELIAQMLSFVDSKLINDLRPSLVISTGGGYQLIYLIDNFVDIELYRPVKDDDEKQANDLYIRRRSYITNLAHEFEAHLRTIIPADLPIKVDNMSNIDRVMRLPGTVNYPKSEKIAKGQTPALSHIAVDNHCRVNIPRLRDLVPAIQPKHELSQVKFPYFPRKDPKWPPYKKAHVCCEFIQEQGLADSNEWYTLNVMLPLIGAIHDPDDNNTLTQAEAEECFMLAVSGGARYGSIGRGPGYFRRQWRSHRPELARNGTKSLGGLIFAAKENGFKLPWEAVYVFEDEYQRQLTELTKTKTKINDEIAKEIGKYGTLVA